MGTYVRLDVVAAAANPAFIVWVSVVPADGFHRY